MKPGDVKSGNYAEYNVNSNDKDPKFQLVDHVRISKCKNIFGKGYTPNWSEEIFVIKKVKNTLPWTYIINDFNGEELLEYFMKKNCRRQKVIKKKANTLYVKWEGYDDSFNSWIDKKDILK